MMQMFRDFDKWSIAIFDNVLGVFSRCCMMHRGGSSNESEICELERRYGERHIYFEQKSVVEA